MKTPTIIKVHALIGKDTFDTIEDGDALALSLYDSLNETGYALLNFKGIKAVTKEAIHRAMENFIPEKNSCRILIVHHKPDNPEVSAHFHLEKTIFPSKKGKIT